MSIAVIKTGGKQYLVKPGSRIKIEKIKDKKEGDTVEFTEVLLLSKGKKLQIGKPLVRDAKISGEIVESGRGRKILTVKFKAKSHYKKKIGHRQPYMRVKIAEF